MPLDNYENLKASIIEHLDRNDLNGFVDDFIDLAEARHKREIRIREMLMREALAIAGRYVSLPAGFLEVQSLRLLTNPVRVLTYVDAYEMNRRRCETTGKPQVFTIHGTELEFDRAPDATLDGEIIFYETLTPLSDANPANALLVRAPDAYLYSSLAASEPFLNDDERIQVWESGYTSAVSTLALTERRARTVGPLFSRVAGATP